VEYLRQASFFSNILGRIGLYHDCIHREVANLPTLELVWKAVILSKASVNYKEKRVALVEGEVIGAVRAILVVVGLGP
jgi:hypothetical protein